MKTVSIQDIPRNAAEGVIIDVRTPAEHAQAHLQRAHDHVPLDTLDPRDFMMRRGLDKDASIYILCRSGGRATTAAQKFTSEGFSNVFVIEGGILSAEAFGEPVVKSEAANDAGPAINVEKAKSALNGVYGKMATYSLERQTMMMAGAVIFLSMVLGFAGAEIFYGVALFAGASLFYKGMTGFCLGEKLMAKAPWNKGKTCGANMCSTTKGTGTGGCA
jgi:rhodanese-related sulfurtransferase